MVLISKLICTFVHKFNFKDKFMKIRISFYTMVTGFILFIVSCNPGKNANDSNLAPNARKVIAEEVIQGSRYTYVRVAGDTGEYWVAISKADVKEKETYYWSIGAEMKEFTSKELKRTFRSIFFIQDFTDKPITVPGTPKMPLTSMAGKQQAPEYPGIVVPKAKGGVTIAELYAGKNSMQGKIVKVCGKVVKYSGGIMDRNWIHMQDGTKDNGKFDLAISTKDSVKVGEIVTFEGKIAIDKNIGAGYIYEILMEDARLVH
jgi:hypothetical protein